MSDGDLSPRDPFDAPVRDAGVLAEEALLVACGGYEGPLDLLLTLARGQKVDLRRISILALAQQYLDFVAQARALRLELAADYLVMAAWLAYLKSRLLLPQPDAAEGPSAADLAARLAFQLERLEAIRRAAARLMALDQLGRDVFARGEAQGQGVVAARPTATLADLLAAYGRIRTRAEYRPLQVDRAQIYSMDQALARLAPLVGCTLDWADLAAFLPEDWRTGARRRSALAATFVACLELARRGAIELAQDGSFAPLRLRARGQP